MSVERLSVTPSHAEPGFIITDRKIEVDTGAAQIEGKTGNRWTLVLTWANISNTNKRNVLGVMAELHGGRNRLAVPWVELGYVRQGAGGGASPRLNGAAAAGAVEVDAQGMAISTTVLERGDLVQIENELKLVKNTVTTNASGEASIGIFPELHKDLADNTDIEYDDPAGIFRMVDMSSMPIEPFPDDQLITAFSIMLEEDVLA